MRIVHPVRSFLVKFFAATPAQAGWEKRLLLINLEALGDLIIFTGVLKHYRAAFPERRITLLIKAGTGLENFFKPDFVDEVICVEYRRFAANPWYSFRWINALRKTGFETVINQDFSASEIMGKIIATSIGASQVAGSDGLALEYMHPFDFQQRRNLKIVNRILAKYTTLVPTRQAHRGSEHPGALEYYVRIFETVSGRTEKDYATAFPSRAERETVLRKFDLANRPYCVLNVSASGVYKRWPTERFAAVTALFKAKGWLPVVIGSGLDRPIGERFTALVPESLNLAGKTSLPELREIMSGAELVLTNDTSTVHMAIALKRPCLAVAGAGPGGMLADYGYPDIHRWVYARLACYGDNWQCLNQVGDGELVPCMAAITVAMVSESAEKLLNYISESADSGRSLPAESFRVKFEPIL